MSLFRNKRRVTTEEAGRVIATHVTQVAVPFCEDVIPDICKALNLDPKDYPETKIFGEMLYLTLWAAIKAFGDQPPELVHATTQSFFQLLSAGDQTQSRGMYETYLHKKRIYDEAWDDDSRGNQSILCLHVLGQLFFKGSLDKRALNVQAMFPLNMYILLAMKSSLDWLPKLKIVD